MAWLCSRLRLALHRTEPLYVSHRPCSAYVLNLAISCWIASGLVTMAISGCLKQDEVDTKACMRLAQTGGSNMDRATLVIDEELV